MLQLTAVAFCRFCGESTLITTRTYGLRVPATGGPSAMIGQGQIPHIGYAGAAQRRIQITDAQLIGLQAKLEACIETFHKIFQQLTPAERAFYSLPANSTIQ